MSYLLDTHILLWALESPEKLPDSIALILNDPEALIYFSVISLWELVTKRTFRPQDGIAEPRLVQSEAMHYGFRQLELTHRHVFTLAALAPLHRDPFDRMLVAQARAEQLSFLTVDREVLQYLPRLI